MIQEEYNLILQDNDLAGTLHFLMPSGYALYINWDAAKISEIKIKLTYKLDKKNKKKQAVKYNIKTQSLGRGRVDEDAAVSTEEKYKVNGAFFDLDKAVFNKGLGSFYSTVDVKVLDNCRTTIPHRMFHKVVDGTVVRVCVKIIVI